MNKIKQTNIQRRRVELALKETVERLANLGGSVSASLNRSEPKMKFASRYKQLIKTAKEQLDKLEESFTSIEHLLKNEQIKQEKEKQDGNG